MISLLELPLNEDAIIFAVGSNAAGMYYGINTFKIKQQQDIRLEMKPISKEKLLEAMGMNGLDGLNLEAEENQMRIEKTDCDEKPLSKPYAVRRAV